MHEALLGSQSQAAVLIARCDRDMRYRYVNWPYARRVDMTPDQLIGKNVAEILGDAAYERILPYVERALAGERVEAEFSFPIQNHGVHYVWVSYEPEYDDAGQVNGFIAAIIDRTEARRIEQALRLKEEQFSRFMHALPGLAWIKDLEGRYVYVNDAALRAFGKRREELIGHTDNEIFPPATAALFRENDRRAIESNGAVQATETLVHPDKSRHHSLVSKFVIPDHEGRPAYVGGVAIDITERLHFEEALRDADRRKDEFLATLAHELRNPLSPIQHGVDLLSTTARPRDIELARQTIARQAAQMSRLLDDLLDVSRITRNKLELRRQPLELRAVLDQAVETVRPIIEQAGHSLLIDIPDEQFRLDGDLARLDQIFSNLLNNAAKYTPPGGRITLCARREGASVVVRVSDSGIGIPPQMLASIFDLFVQVDRSLEKSRGGLGIGLTLVKRLVEMHGGTVEAKSKGTGMGSEFTVRLPAMTNGEIQTPATRPPFNEKVLSGRKILVADDNDDAANMLSILLKKLGSDVKVARDGLEVLEVAEVFMPDVILMDIGMPRLNGYDTARRIREKPWGREVVLIAQTGWGQEEDRRKSQQAGFDHHMVKPLEIGTLREILFKEL